MTIDYTTGDAQYLDLVGPLWLRLQAHHVAVGREFSAAMRQATWDERKAGLLKKTAGGRLWVDLARDAEAGSYVGYCLTSLTPEGKGEIESLFVEADYRRRGIGDCLMRRALRFLDECGATRRTLGVAAGNEGVFGFYRRYGFVPRATILQQLPGDSKAQR